jgi:hypothetical protein
MKSRFKYLVLPFVFSASFTLLGCANESGKVMTEMSFNHLQPYPLYVASYEIFTTPQTDTLQLPEGFVANPVTIAHDYFTNRFHATGTQGKMSVVIDNATIKHSIENSQNTVGAFIGVDHYDVYDITMLIKLDIFDVKGYQKQENKIRVNRSVSISEHVSLAERERLQMQALDELMDDVDDGVKNILGEDLGILH